MSVDEVFAQTFNEELVSDEGVMQRSSNQEGTEQSWHPNECHLNVKHIVGGGVRVWESTTNGYFK